MQALLSDTDNLKCAGFESVVDGESYVAVVGQDGVTEIRYHTPMGDGDRHFLDVYVAHKLKYREFNFTTIEFES